MWNRWRGAVELIRLLNQQGFSTIIATNTEIKGLMAGTFLKLFAEEISRSDPMKPQPLE